MPTKRNSNRFKQQYSTNSISNQTAGRKNNAELTSKNGKYNGSRKAQSTEQGGSLGRNAQWVKREGAYRDVRAGFNDISPRAARAMLEAGQITQAEYDRMYGNGTGNGTGRGTGRGGASGSGKRGLGLSVG